MLKRDLFRKPGTDCSESRSKTGM